jgi:hypothetical protein
MNREHDGDITPGMNSYYGDIEAGLPQTIAKPKRAWGSSGIRYDEDCERCGRNGQVDNDSGLCKRCGA